MGVAAARLRAGGRGCDERCNLRGCSGQAEFRGFAALKRLRGNGMTERLDGDGCDELGIGCAQGRTGERRSGRVGRDGCALVAAERARGWCRGRRRSDSADVRRRPVGGASDLNRRCGLKQRGSGRLEVHGGLHTGLDAAGDENPFESAVAELGGIGVERVLSGIERGEAEGAVLGGGGADFSAGGLVAQNDGDAGQRRRMQIGEAAARASRIEGIESGRSAPAREPGGSGWAETTAQAHRQSAPNTNHQNPVPPCFCHCQRCPGRSWEKGEMSRRSALAAGPAGRGEGEIFAALSGSKRSLAAILCLRVAAEK